MFPCQGCWNYEHKHQSVSYKHDHKICICQCGLELQGKQEHPIQVHALDHNQENLTRCTEGDVGYLIDPSVNFLVQQSDYPQVSLEASGEICICGNSAQYRWTGSQITC